MELLIDGLIYEDNRWVDLLIDGLLSGLIDGWINLRNN
jgi:hypothetical protein